MSAKQGVAKDPAGSSQSLRKATPAGKNARLPQRKAAASLFTRPDAQRHQPSDELVSRLHLDGRVTERARLPLLLLALCPVRR